MNKNFKFKKKFGQNFLQDNNIINKIVNEIDIKDNNLIIEIGPGSGALTKYLKRDNSTLFCYEIDEDLKSILDEKYKSNVIYDDFLKRNLSEDFKNCNYSELKIVGNLPYYITTPIIKKIIDSKLDVSKMVFMVQKEVGERFLAKPGNKSYGSLTVFLNCYFNMKKVVNVSKNSFVPKPNVDSVVVSFEKKEKLKVKNEEVLFKLIRDSFQFKRKTLKNNLKDYDLKKIEEALIKYNYDLSVRAEKLSLDIFVEIADKLIEGKNVKN